MRGSEVTRSYFLDLWHDHWGQIFPSDFGARNWYIMRHRPLITRITEAEGLSEESRGLTVRSPVCPSNEV